MTDDTHDLRVSPATDLTVQTLAQVQTTSPELPAPSFVSDAVSPEVTMVEWREWFNSISYKAPCSMGVQAQHERDEQVMGIPERLEALLSDLCVGRCVHQQHAQ
jgi:hypothetical protein